MTIAADQRAVPHNVDRPSATVGGTLPRQKPTQPEATLVVAEGHPHMSSTSAAIIALDAAAKSAADTTPADIPNPCARPDPCAAPLAEPSSYHALTATEGAADQRDCVSEMMRTLCRGWSRCGATWPPVLCCACCATLTIARCMYSRFLRARIHKHDIRAHACRSHLSGPNLLRPHEHPSYCVP